VGPHFDSRMERVEDFLPTQATVWPSRLVCHARRLHAMLAALEDTMDAQMWSSSLRRRFMVSLGLFDTFAALFTAKLRNFDTVAFAPRSMAAQVARRGLI